MHPLAQTLNSTGNVALTGKSVVDCGHDWEHDTKKDSSMPYLREMFTRVARDRSPDPAMTRIVRRARRFWLPLILAVAVAAIILLLIWPGWAYQWSWTGF